MLITVHGSNKEHEMLKYETEYHELILSFKSYRVLQRKKPFKAHDQMMNFYIVFSGSANMYSLFELMYNSGGLSKRKKQILKSVLKHLSITQDYKAN